MDKGTIALIMRSIYGEKYYPQYHCRPSSKWRGREENLPSTEQRDWRLHICHCIFLQQHGDSYKKRCLLCPILLIAIIITILIKTKSKQKYSIIYNIKKILISSIPMFKGSFFFIKYRHGWALNCLQVHTNILCLLIECEVCYVGQTNWFLFKSICEHLRLKRILKTGIFCVRKLHDYNHWKLWELNKSFR